MNIDSSKFRLRKVIGISLSTLVDGFIEILEDADIDVQLMLLSYLKLSFLERILESDEDQVKRLREAVINMQKSPHRQIRDIARKYSDEVKRSKW